MAESDRTLSRIKIKQDNATYPIKDSGAIRKIIFNGQTYISNNKGEVAINDSLRKELEVTNTLVKEVVNYGDTIELTKNGFYVVKENNNAKFSGYSLFVYDNEKLIRLTTPTFKFESDDINFEDMLRKNKYPKYITWDAMYASLTQTETLKRLKGTNKNGAINKVVNYVYLCKKEVDPNTYAIKPYVVYLDGNYVFKQYCTENPDGSINLSSTYTYCATSDTQINKNNFARSIDVKRT